MAMIDKIRQILIENNYEYNKDLYFIFMYVSNVYTGLITKDRIDIYTDKQVDSLPNDETFFEGYVFNEDIQLNIENDEELSIKVIKEDMLSNYDTIEENMYVLNDGKINLDTLNPNYTKFKQSNKTVIIPKKISNYEYKYFALKVVNYIDYDKDDFPFVRYVRFKGFYPYNGGKR